MLFKLILSVLAIVAVVPNALGLGETNYVSERGVSESFPLFERSAAPMMIDSNDWQGVLRAAKDLRGDIGKVTGKEPESLAAPGLEEKAVVIVGTIGRGALIQRL